MAARRRNSTTGIPSHDTDSPDGALSFGAARRRLNAYTGRVDRSLDTLLQDQTLTTHRVVTAHWLDLYAAAGNRVPRLRDLDAIRFAAALPDVWIVDAETDGRYRFHLAGQSLIDWYGSSPKGLYMEQIYPPAVLAFITVTAESIIGKPAVCFQKATSLTRNWNLPIPMERLGFPMVDDAGRVRHIFGITTFFSREGHGQGPEPSKAEVEIWYPVSAGRISSS